MRATKSGFLNPVENIPADMKSLPWLCENGKIHSTYQSLDKRDKEMTARVDSLSARNDQLAMEHPSIGAIWAMGTRNTKDLREDVDKYCTQLFGFTRGNSMKNRTDLKSEFFCFLFLPS